VEVEEKSKYVGKGSKFLGKRSKNEIVK